MATPAAVFAIKRNGTSRTPSTSNKSPTSRRRSRTPSRSWTTCRRTPASRVCRRLSANNSCYSTGRIAPQPPNLLQVVPSVHQVKLPPLLPRERAQDRVVEQLYIRAVFFLATTDRGVHVRDLLRNLRDNLFARQPARPRGGRCFSSTGHVPEPHDQKKTGPLFPVGRFDHRTFSRQQTVEAFDGPGVGQVEVLEHLGSTPLSRRMTVHLVRAHS